MKNKLVIKLSKKPYRKCHIFLVIYIAACHSGRVVEEVIGYSDSNITRCTATAQYCAKQSLLISHG